mmetsp:Transcript_54394/g.129626  ORF Transcript_54394/g.129626 Transcript_54394/m.129626 type:complete len:342 (-) Transcript_54394:37-1062(-)
MCTDVVPAVASNAPADFGLGPPGSASEMLATMTPPPKADEGTERSHRRRFRNKRDLLGSLLTSGHLPSRQSTLDPQCMLKDLPEAVASQVCTYCAHAFGGNSSEVARCVQAASDACPHGLRVKELLETFEVYHSVAAFAHDAGKARALEVIVDAACGHGMLGVLLAYRFPHKRVLCVDKERRDLFAAFVEAFRQHGTPAAGEDAVLSNLEFREADALTLELSTSTLLVAVHACNDLCRQLLDMAVRAEAFWAVLPCCIRAGTYVPCSLGGALRDDDEAKHVLHCGIVAGRFGAERVQAIDRRITNRNICICGGIGIKDREESRRLCSQGMPAAGDPEVQLG